MNLDNIIEDLNNLMEDELIDQFSDMEDTELSTNSEDKTSDLSLTDQLDARTNISRCLDNLKSALDNFKSAALPEINLIKDSNILNALEKMDSIIKDITSALSGQLNVEVTALDTDINDIEHEEPTNAVSSEEDNMNADSEESENEDALEDEEVSDNEFEDQAEYEIFN